MNASSCPRQLHFAVVVAVSMALSSLSANVEAALVFVDDFTGSAGSIEGRSTDGATSATNGTYYHVNANLVYTDGVSNLTAVNPATATPNFAQAAIDILAGGNVDTTNSIVTATLQINSNRVEDGGNGSNFGTLFVDFQDFGFLGVPHPQSGPIFQFDSFGAPFKMMKPGISPLTPEVSSDTGNVAAAFLGVENKIELIYNTSTLAYQLKHNDTLVHADFLTPDPNNVAEVAFWNYPTFDNVYFQFNSSNWVVDYISLDVTPIPEPGAVALLGIGLLVPAIARWRQ